MLKEAVKEGKYFHAKHVKKYEISTGRKSNRNTCKGTV
jgi:hypothetical protein